MRECIEEGFYSYIFDEPYVTKRSLDPILFVGAWCSAAPWRVMTVLDTDETAIEHRSTGEKIVHDIWSYGDPFDDLENLLAENAGTDRMVIIMRTPDLRQGPGKRFLRLCRDLQEDFPDSKMHIHGLYSWAYLFGMNWASVDIEPRVSARGGQVNTPNGKRVKHQNISQMPEWVHVLGMRVVDLQKPRLRCIYNLRSADWAAKNYKLTPRFTTLYKPRNAFEPKKPRRVFFRYVEPEEGDKLVCNTCSLADHCRFYREGAICAVPDSDVANLADYFNTRDADAVLEGLGELLATQLGRLQRGMDQEEAEEKAELSPAVTTLFDKIFKDGVALAKLIDPMLAKPALQINLQGQQQVPPPVNKQALIAAVVRELEARGVPRDEITPEMVQELLEERAAQAALTR